MTESLDARIEEDVLRELVWDRAIDADGIQLAVAHGRVTLRGTVTSYAQKLDAAEAAHRVPGVLDVVNELYVRPLGSDARTDEEIADAVRHTLQWNAEVPHTKITTTVSGGVVTLGGEVPTTEARVATSRAIRTLTGVRGIVDMMRVVGEELVAQQIATAIRGAFERHARRDATHVDIDVHDGVATLSGDVHSWAERQVVIGAARGTRGIRDVIDRLRVDPYARH